MCTAIAAFILGVQLNHGMTTSCPGFQFLSTSLIVIPAIQFFFTVLTIIFAFTQLRRLASFSRICAALLSLSIAALAIFALAVTHQPRNKADSSHLDSYYNPDWLRNQISAPHYWEIYYRKAIVDNSVCYRFHKDYKCDTLDEFHNRKLSSLQDGCCKPPKACQFDYVSPTNWTKHVDHNLSYAEGDCDRWDNDPSVLCLDCESCKSGFLQNVKFHWHKTGLIIIVCFLIANCIRMLYKCCCEQSLLKKIEEDR